MKKLLLSLTFLALTTIAGAFWGANNWENQSDVQLSTTNSPVGILNPAPIRFDSPDKGMRDCITKLSFSGDNFPAAGATLRLIAASSNTLTNQSMVDGTTFYELAWTTGVITDYWDFQNPICSPLPGTTTWITVSTGNYKVNAIGFIRNR